MGLFRIAISEFVKSGKVSRCRSILTSNCRLIANHCSRSNPFTTKSADQAEKAAASLDIAGIYPPIATPFNEDFSIAYDRLTENLKLWDKVPFRGYVVQGSNGEFPYMSTSERVAVVKHVRKATDPTKKLLIAGSGCESTMHTIELTKEMAAVGADAVMVVNPFFYKGSMTNDALRRHYFSVADASPVPVIVYNVPANTGTDMSVELIVSLAAHPNIVGLKDSGGDVVKMGRIVHETARSEDKSSSTFQVLAGSASFLLPALTVGCVGGICALANVLGGPICQLYDLFLQGGSLGEATRLQQRLIVPNLCVTKQFGVSGLKTALTWYGHYGGPCRPPLPAALSREHAAQMREHFERADFL